LLDGRQIAQRDGGQPFGIDLEDSKVGFPVHSHHGGLEHSLLHRLPARLPRAGRREQDQDALRALDHVGVGDDVAGGIDDDPGAIPRWRAMNAVSV